MAALTAGEAPTLPMAVPERKVQTQVSEDELDRLLGRIEKEFVFMGENEPYWSVLTAEQYKIGNLSQQNEEEFFLSGRLMVGEMEMAARRNGVELPKSGVCFELGCGVGRTTVWLADTFQHVVAADVSGPHLAIPRRAAADRGKYNINFLQVNSRTVFENLPEFDAFLSIIVLQHNPPPLIAFMLGQIFKKLRPGGIAYFQILTYGLDYEFTLDEYLEKKVPPGTPELHVLPQRELFRLMEQADCELVEIREDRAAGRELVSNRLLIRKKSVFS
jgi:SAM-dependent methyltransferase